MSLEKLPNESIFGFYEGNDTADFTDLNGENLNKSSKQLLANDLFIHHLLEALDQESRSRTATLSAGTTASVNRIDDTADLDRSVTLAKDTIHNNRLDAIETLLQSDDTTLDELQEVVDFIKLNAETISLLSIDSIAGLRNALNSILADIQALDDDTAAKMAISDNRLDVIEADLVAPHNEISMGSQDRDTNWDGIVYDDADGGGSWKFVCDQGIQDSPRAKIKTSFSADTNAYLDGDIQPRSFEVDVNSSSNPDWLYMGVLKNFTDGRKAMFKFLTSAGYNTNKVQQSFIKLHLNMGFSGEVRPIYVEGLALNEGYGLNSVNGIASFKLVENGSDIHIYAQRSSFVDVTYELMLSSSDIDYQSAHTKSSTPPTGNVKDIEIYQSMNTTNGGHTSGFDADMLDGVHGSDYVRTNAISNSVSSTSSTKVASSAAVKSAYDKALAAELKANSGVTLDQLKQAMNTGRSVLATDTTNARFFWHNRANITSRRYYFSDAFLVSYSYTYDWGSSYDTSGIFYPGTFYNDTNSGVTLDQLKQAMNTGRSVLATDTTNARFFWHNRANITSRRYYFSDAFLVSYSYTYDWGSSYDTSGIFYPGTFYNDTGFTMALTLVLAAYGYNSDDTNQTRILVNGVQKATATFARNNSNTLTYTYNVPANSSANIRVQGRITGGANGDMLKMRSFTYSWRVI